MTVALCGHWEHEPPCPLAPHHTQVDRIGGEVRVRILFAAQPHLEGAIRELIESALSGEQLWGLGSTITRWGCAIANTAPFRPRKQITPSA